MPSYIITLKDDATDEQLQEAKRHVIDQGGKIGHEYTLIKGFSFEVEENNSLSISTLSSQPYVEGVEADQVVTTQ